MKSKLKAKSKVKAKARTGVVHKTFRARAKSKSANSVVAEAAVAETRRRLREQRKPLTPQQRVQAALAGNEAPAEYDTNAFYNTGRHYVVTDPPPVIIPGKAKPNLGLSRRTDSDLVGFGHSHDEAVDGNPYFVTLQPSKAVFDAKLGELEAILTALENHRIAGKALTDQRNIIRGEFELLFTQRGDYVALLSEGDAGVIMSAGMPVRNPPTPTGILPPPLGLRADWTQLEGQLMIRWDAMTAAKGGYLLEMAEVVNNVAVGWKIQYMGGKFSTLQTGLESGKTYAFRVAAVGGEGGRSAFSPEVWRAVA